MKYVCTDVFVLVRGKCHKKTISFPLHLSAQTGSPRILLFQPRYYHPSTTSPRHTNVFCRLSWKNFACCFLVQSRPNTIANQQRIVIWHYVVRFDKIFPCLTSRSHLFLRLFDKMYRACNADQSKDNCFFVFLNCWTSSRSQKTYSHLFSVLQAQVFQKSPFGDFLL